MAPWSSQLSPLEQRTGLGLILGDVGDIVEDQQLVLVELIAARYERRSLLITANQPFGELGKTFTDKPMTLAAIDRLRRLTALYLSMTEKGRAARSATCSEGFGSAVLEQVMAEHFEVPPRIDFAPGGVCYEVGASVDGMIG